MSWRVAVLLTAALTAFVLVVAGALAIRLGASPGGSGQEARTDGSEAKVPLRVVLQREQRYRERLEEANARLNWAYGEIRRLQGKLFALSAQVPGSPQGMGGDSEGREGEEGWEGDEEGSEGHAWDDD
jgi:hypothetical protein